MYFIVFKSKGINGDLSTQTSTYLGAIIWLRAALKEAQSVILFFIKAPYISALIILIDKLS